MDAIRMQLAAKVTELKQALEREARDAARYRWLRDHDSQTTGIGIYVLHNIKQRPTIEPGPVRAEQIDAAIDAAMSAEIGEKK